MDRAKVTGSLPYCRHWAMRVAGSIEEANDIKDDGADKGESRWGEAGRWGQVGAGKREGAGTGGER